MKHKEGLVFRVDAEEAQFFFDTKVAAVFVRKGWRNQDFSSAGETDQTSIKCPVEAKPKGETDGESPPVFGIRSRLTSALAMDAAETALDARAVDFWVERGARDRLRVGAGKGAGRGAKRCGGRGSGAASG